MKKVCCIVFFLICIFCTSTPLHAATISPVDVDATVSVTIGKQTTTPVTPVSENTRFSIYGFTSPNAKVVIQNPGIHSETYADKDGAFRFQYLFVSLFREDICMIAYDTSNRSTPPVCIPPPGSDTVGEMGPVLLPPSTSISAGNAYIGDSITLSGQTIPNTDVKLSMFTDELQQNKKITLIPTAYAYTMPVVELKSDSKGNYSLTLPTAGSQFFRMFSRAFYQGNSTPKSLTLVLDIFPLWMLLIKFFLTLFDLLRAHLLEIVILLQLYVIFIYFIRKFFRPHFLVNQRRQLALRRVELLSLPHGLVQAPGRE